MSRGTRGLSWGLCRAQGLLGKQTPASGLVSTEIPRARHPQGPAAHAAARRDPAPHAAQGPLSPQVSPPAACAPTAGMSPRLCLPITVFLNFLELSSARGWRGPPAPRKEPPVLLVASGCQLRSGSVLLGFTDIIKPCVWGLLLVSDPRLPLGSHFWVLGSSAALGLIKLVFCWLW